MKFTIELSAQDAEVFANTVLRSTTPIVIVGRTSAAAIEAQRQSHEIREQAKKMLADAKRSQDILFGWNS